MADLTEKVSDRASHDADDGQEWLPPQIEQELRRPIFARLATEEPKQRRTERHEPAPVRQTRRFAPSRAAVATASPPVASERVGSEMLRRLSEVEARVANAAQAVDRSARNVRTLVERNGETP